MRILSIPSALALVVIALTACQSAPTERMPTASHGMVRDFAARGVVDIAVMQPTMPEGTPDSVVTETRAAASSYLLRSKRYSVLRHETVDGAEGPDASLDPETARSRSGANAVLKITIDNLDRRDQTSHGRVFASGSLRLLGPNAEELWHATFTDHREIIAISPDPASWEDDLVKVMRGLVRDKLEKLPMKPATTR